MTNDLIRRSALLKKAIRVSEFDECGWERVLRAVPVEDIEAAEAVGTARMKCERMTVFERIKAMDIDEMAEFIRPLVDENQAHAVACYGCIHFGTHHSDPGNKGTNLYECDGCVNEGIGLDLVAWLNSDGSILMDGDER